MFLAQNIVKMKDKKNKQKKPTNTQTNKQQTTKTNMHNRINGIKNNYIATKRTEIVIDSTTSSSEIEMAATWLTECRLSR